MKKFIFLDFDGVIAVERSRYRLDEEKCKMIQDIIDRTDAKIVISSSWRYNTLEATIKDLSTISHRIVFVPSWIDNIVGVTIREYHYCTKDEEVSQSLIIPRGVEIDEWLRRNLPEEYYDKDAYRYVILDDDTDMLYDQRNNFIKTDTYKGINKRNVEKAVKILNEPPNLRSNGL